MLFDSSVVWMCHEKQGVIWYVLARVCQEAGEDTREFLGQQGDQTNLMGNKPWILIGMIDAEAEAPLLWSPYVNSQLTGKLPDAGKDEGRRTGRQWMTWLDGINHAMDINLGKLPEMVRDRKAWQVAVHVITKSQTWVDD